MKAYTAGATTEEDLNGTALPGVSIRLTGTDTVFGDDSVARRVTVSIKIGKTGQLLTGDGNITVTPKIGPNEAGTRPLESHVKTVPCRGLGIIFFETEPINLSAVDDSLTVWVYSDDVADVDVTILATVTEVGPITDSNGRTDVGLVGGATPISGTGWVANLISFLQRH